MLLGRARGLDLGGNRDFGIGDARLLRHERAERGPHERAVVTRSHRHLVRRREVAIAEPAREFVVEDREVFMARDERGPRGEE